MIYEESIADEYSSRCLRDVTGQAKYVYSQAITSQMCVNSPRIRVANLTYEEASVVFFLEGPRRYCFLVYRMTLDADMSTLFISHICVRYDLYRQLHDSIIHFIIHYQFPRKISTQISKLDGNTY